MNPFLSWGIVSLCFVVIYVCARRPSKSPFGKAEHDRHVLQNRSIEPIKKTKRKARAIAPQLVGHSGKIDEANQEKNGIGASDDASEKLSVESSTLNSPQSRRGQDAPSMQKRARKTATPSSKPHRDQSGKSISPAPWYNNNADLTVSHTSSESGHKASDSIQQSIKVDTAKGVRQESQAARETKPTTRDSEASWQVKGRSHAINDMLEHDGSFVARTLKITPATNAVPEKTSRPKKELQASATKKQRQNAAKKEKAKAEKAELERQQALAFKAHAKSLEAQKIAAFIKQENKVNSASSAPPRARRQDDWETVSSAKSAGSKKVGNGQSASVDLNGKLIWE